MIDEPYRICNVSDNSSFAVVYIFSFALIQGEAAYFSIVADRQVADGKRGGFQNVIAHTEE